MSCKDPAKDAARFRRLRQRRGYSTAKNAAWQARYPEKRAAHKAVERALLRGDLTRLPCERCGALKAQAHHDDYLNPLDVMWLCQVHHKARHKELADAERSRDEAAAFSLQEQIIKLPSNGPTIWSPSARFIPMNTFTFCVDAESAITATSSSSIIPTT